MNKAGNITKLATELSVAVVTGREANSNINMAKGRLTSKKDTIEIATNSITGNLNTTAEIKVNAKTIMEP